MTIATRHAPSVNIPLADDDHEQIVIRQDKETGLRFIVAVHSTVLGPALGGMRLKRYPGGLREALDDGRRLHADWDRWLEANGERYMISKDKNDDQSGGEDGD